MTPGTPDPNQPANPGQVDGEGCVYPASVKTIASQLDAKYPPHQTTHVAAWRAYEQDMGNTPARDGGTPDPTGGTDCGHPAIGATDTAEVATTADQYTTRHDPFVWFHSVIDNEAECDANVVPLGTLGPTGTPLPTGHLARDLQSEKTTPRFAFITPNLCDDGHDGTCAGPNSTGGHVGGLTGADEFLRAWMPLILGSPAYKHGDMLVVITFDESDTDGPGDSVSCCNEQPGPNTHAPGDAGDDDRQRSSWWRADRRSSLNAKYVVAGSTDTTGSYNHYSALRSYEDLLGLTTAGNDGEGHLGFAARAGLAPLGLMCFGQAQPRPQRVPLTRHGGSTPEVSPAGGARLVARHVGDVLGCRQPDHRHVRPALEDLGRHPQGQRARRHDHVVRDDGIGADRRAPADHGPVQDDAARPGQRVVLERASLEVGQVPDHAAVADDGGETRAGVDDRAVLDGGPRADRDRAVVAAQDRPGHTLDAGPMVTSPMTTASGWTKAPSSICGATPPSS